MKFSDFSSDKYDTGLRFVLNSLELSSPFGHERLVALEFLDEAGIASAHDNLERAIAALQADSVLAALSPKLQMLKDLRKCAAALKTRVLEDFELFELKCFLIIYEECAALHNNRITVLPQLRGALDILDFDGKRAMTFRVDEQHSGRLAVIRKKKLAAEESLFKAPENRELVAERASLAAAEAEEELTIRTGLCERLSYYAETLSQAMLAIGELDFLLAKAGLAMKYCAVRPITSGKPIFRIVDAFNPYADSFLQKHGSCYTPVSIELKPGATIITGANMGGKSLSMKTFLLNQLLFQLGFFVFAKGAELCVFDDIIPIFGDGQSTENGLSSFGAQITELNRAFKSIKVKRTLLIADELAGGTNPHEGERLVRAIVKTLNRYESISLLSTHYDNVAVTGIRRYQVIGLKNCDFTKLANELQAGSFDINTVSREMDYRLELQEGETGAPRDALHICILLGVVKEILDEIEVE